MKIGLKALTLSTTLLVFCLFNTPVLSQQSKITSLELSSGTVNFEPNSMEKFSNEKTTFGNAFFRGHYYCITKLEHTTQKGTVIDGIEHLNYLSDNVWFSRIASEITAEDLSSRSIQAVAVLPSALKLSAALANHTMSGSNAGGQALVPLAITFPKQLKANTVIQEFSNMGGINIQKDLARYGIITGEFPVATIGELAELPFVLFIETWSEETQPLNKNHPASSRGSALTAAGFEGARGLTGKNIIIGMGDGGEIPMSGPGYHIDRSPNIFNETEGTAAGWGVHADHIAGTISGNGNLNQKYAGLAPLSTLVTEKSSQIIYRLDTLKSTYGITLINGSFGPSGSECTNYGDYTAVSAILDQQANTYPDVLHIFAAGNSGTDVCGAYPLGYKTVLREFASAKNSLAVGVVKNKRRDIEGSSSRGPVTDGRIKPEITAAGVNVKSTLPGNVYSNITGTSMAAAGVTGHMALISERYGELHNGASPDGGLLKAVVCNTAKDRGNPGPDYIYGFGVINSRRAIETLEENRYFAGSITNGQVIQHTIEVPSETHEVRALLYWVDKEGNPMATKALVNDLDITVSKGAESYQPWILNPDPALVNEPAVRGTDHLNNIEQVTFQPAGSGTYTIEVTGFDVPVGPQNYYIAYEIIQPSIVLTYPFGGESFDFNVNEDIRWDAFGPNADQVTIEVSLDGGFSWAVLPAFDAVSNAEEFTRWYIPEVNTSKALVKATITGTNIYDITDDFVTLTGIPQNFQADASCESNARLTWDPVEGISQYEVMVLDTVMKVLLTTHNTTALIPGLDPGKGYWFAVRSKLEDGTTGPRAESIYVMATAITCSSTPDASADYISGIKDKGREFTSTTFSSAEIVTVEVSNLGNTTISNFHVSFQVNGGSIVSENFSGTLTPGASASHTFNTSIDLTTPGVYTIDAWTDLPGDVDISNDAVSHTKTAHQLANVPVQFPLAPENFELAEETVIILDHMGFGGLTRCDFNTNSETGRLRTNAGSGFTNGNRAATLDAAFDQTRTINELILTYNLSSQNPEELFLNFQFMQHGQEEDAANTVFVRGSDLDEWISVYDLDENQGPPGIFSAPAAPIELINILDTNGQTISSSFQVRFCQAGEVNADNQYGNDGYTFDNIELINIALPIELVSFEATPYNQNDVRLDWETYTETNNSGFEIQVAENDDALAREEFTTVNFVEGAGTSTGPISYTYIDKNILTSETRYYRLKQIDFDGSYSYSQVRAVRVSGQTDTEVSVFPNPMVSDLNVRYNAAAGDVATFKITDASGRFVTEYHKEITTGGSQKETIGLEGLLTTGVYFLHTTVGDDKTVTRFVKTYSF